MFCENENNMRHVIINKTKFVNFNNCNRTKFLRDYFVKNHTYEIVRLHVDLVEIASRSR